MVPLQGETNSKEEEQLWLEEKKIWIPATENIRKNGESLVLDEPHVEENEIEPNSKRPERPSRFF